MAEDAYAHAVAMEVLKFPLQHLFEQVHQEMDFLARAPPILSGKCKHRQHGHAQIPAFVNDIAQGFNTGAMPAERINPRSLAQRPLPSMITAM